MTWPVLGKQQNRCKVVFLLIRGVLNEDLRGSVLERQALATLRSTEIEKGTYLFLSMSEGAYLFLDV